MASQMTEMLKGTLEGIVLAILAERAAYGYEITAWLREQGFTEIAEGTVYALLVRIEQRGFVDVERVPSEKGPPRKVYSLNPTGRDRLTEFWRTWGLLSERIEQLRPDAAHKADRTGPLENTGSPEDTGSSEQTDLSENTEKEGA
ncbi:PadR family transcriptional regulator [Brevibacterium sp.]|uniref:PadR family transcriptional regulator n=1 Tax=Brevibacterium sp. TaxID=1701 RepID=UPI0025C1D3C2|nr:PadR family transcriptional regulator [Brevibacterium sp.]